MRLLREWFHVAKATLLGEALLAFMFTATGFAQPAHVRRFLPITANHNLRHSLMAKSQAF